MLGWHTWYKIELIQCFRMVCLFLFIVFVTSQQWSTVIHCILNKPQVVYKEIMVFDQMFVLYYDIFTQKTNKLTMNLLIYFLNYLITLLSLLLTQRCNCCLKLPLVKSHSHRYCELEFSALHQITRRHPCALRVPIPPRSVVLLNENHYGIYSL